MFRPERTAPIHGQRRRRGFEQAEARRHAGLKGCWICSPPCPWGAHDEPRRPRLDRRWVARRKNDVMCHGHARGTLADPSIPFPPSSRIDLGLEWPSGCPDDDDAHLTLIHRGRGSSRPALLSRHLADRCHRIATMAERSGGSETVCGALLPTIFD